MWHLTEYKWGICSYLFVGLICYCLGWLLESLMAEDAVPLPTLYTTSSPSSYFLYREEGDSSILGNCAWTN